MSRLLGACSAGAVRQVVCFDERMQAETGRAPRSVSYVHHAVPTVNPPVPSRDCADTMRGKTMYEHRFEKMSVGELWKLYEQVEMILARRLIAKKQELEARLERLHANHSHPGSLGQRGPTEE